MNDSILIEGISKRFNDSKNTFATYRRNDVTALNKSVNKSFWWTHILIKKQATEMNKNPQPNRRCLK